MNIYYITILILVISFTLLIYTYYDNIKIWILNRIIVQRGILTPDCFWFNISDRLISDSSGVDLYNKYKKKYGDFAPSYMFGEKIYLVTNNNYIKIIFDNSPDLFSVGKLKYKFFKPFMEKNVGVSTGCPWKRRRYMNEIALVTGKLHTYAEHYNNYMVENLTKWKSKSLIEYSDFLKLGRTIVSKIVFNTDSVNDEFFKIFSEANTTEVFSNPDFKITPKVYNNYLKILNKYIDNPEPNSLVELCLTFTTNREEIQHQIPHFIFPIVALFITTIPRLLLLLCNHKNIFKKVIQEVYSLKDSYMDNYESIYKLTYLRKCILEILRLNNLVVTTFRTLTQDYTFDNKYSFKKGTQFLILNNPVLREEEFFDKPNKFIPSRWTSEMEKSYYAISFNQGPQICPGKELSIYLIQSFIYNFIKIKEIGKNQYMRCKKINTENISQVINPCNIKFNFAHYQ